MAIATVNTGKRTLTFNYRIGAPLQQVYESFINRDNVADWLSNDADIRAEAGGYLLLMWSDGSHAYGTFSEVIENRSLTLSWQDGNDHPATQVRITFESEDDVTLLTLQHTGFEDDQYQQTYEERWTRWLDNLQSILETGANKNITDRVILGVIPADFNAEIAESLGVPVEEGSRVHDVVDGFSAAEAGIQAQDVLTHVEGEPVSSGTGIHNIVREKKPGDTVEVVFYRGADQHTVQVELKGYPIPSVPQSFAEMADRFEERFAEFDRKLSTVLADVDEQAARTHAKNVDNWTVRDILAHSILQKRHTLDWLGSYIEGPRRIAPYTRVQGRLNAIIAVHPTVADLYAELRRTWAEVVAIVPQIPAELEARKNSLWWITFETSMDATYFDLTIERIEANLAT